MQHDILCADVVGEADYVAGNNQQRFKCSYHCTNKHWIHKLYRTIQHKQIFSDAHNEWFCECILFVMGRAQNRTASNFSLCKPLLHPVAKYFLSLNSFLSPIMSKARSTIENSEPSMWSSSLKWLNVNTRFAAEFGWNSWLWVSRAQSVILCHSLTFSFLLPQVYANSRVIGWFIVTTGMITAVPLLFEVSVTEMPL